MGKYYDLEEKAKEKKKKKKPQVRAEEIIRKYYNTLISRSDNPPPDEKARLRDILGKFDSWLYNPVEIVYKIMALEEVYFEIAPCESPILKDMLARLEKMYAVYREMIEQRKGICAEAQIK